MEIIKSLANGIIDTTDDFVVYECPNNTKAITTLISFTETSGSAVVLNVYRFKNNIKYLISPNNFSLGANHLAQENAGVTLEQGDRIIASCSVASAVQFVVSGKEVVTSPIPR